jgi:transcriptional regulator GlxA family with amidase domain
MSDSRLNVAVLIFDDVEVLDFAGPFEVFSRTRLVPGVESRRGTESAPYNVFTVGERKEPILATGGLLVTPEFDFGTAPHIDVLVVPGGWGTRKLLEHPPVLDWIRETAKAARQVSSVCTGALLLARTGLLRSRRATTHWASLDLLATVDPTVKVERGVRFVHDGPITSAGVSAGIDMALAVVEGMFGSDVAADTARYMEYAGRS